MMSRHIQSMLFSGLLCCGLYSVQSFVLPPSEVRKTSFLWKHQPMKGMNRFPGTVLYYLQPGSGTSERDFYSILGLTKTASESEIKGAYRKLAKLYHPDANPERDTTEQFKMLNRAYEVLRDPKLRKSYDTFGNKGIGTSAASDSDNIKRRRTAQQTNGSSYGDTTSSWASHTTKKASQSPTASNFGRSWPSKSQSQKTSGQNIGAEFNSKRERGIDPDPIFVGQRTSYSSRVKNGSTEWSASSYRDPGFNPKPRSNTGFASGTKMGASAYYGDMGSVNSQHGNGRGFEDRMFDFQDGVTSGEAFFGRGPKFGKDVLMDIKVDPLTCKGGVKKTIEITRMQPCGSCGGKGTKDDTHTFKVCTRCGGSGYKIGPSMKREACQDCHGTGSLVNNPCSDCFGVGLQKAKKSLEITVPRHVEDGYTLRIPAEGDAGPNGGPAGDLYVCFKVEGTKESKGQTNAPPKSTPQRRVSRGLRADQQNMGGARGSLKTSGRQQTPMSRPNEPRFKTQGVVSERPRSTPSTGLRADQRTTEPRMNATKSRSRPQSTMTANQRILERSRIKNPNQQMQSERFGSTRRVTPNSNTAASMKPQQRKGRLRGLRNFVSGIWSR